MNEIDQSQLRYDLNSCAETFRCLIGGGPKASPIQLYPVNVSQIMLMSSGDVEPNPVLIQGLLFKYNHGRMM